MEYYKILTQYYQVKDITPSWRLGQHFCTVLDMNGLFVNGRDLFYVRDNVAEAMILEVIEEYHWDINNLPVKLYYNEESDKYEEIK